MRVCRNPRCTEDFEPTWEGGAITGLCPSCRLAGRWGGYVTFGLIGIYKLIAWWLGS